MSCRDLFVLACALCWSCFVDVPSSAHGQTTDLKASARNVLKVNGSKVYGVKSLVKIDASMNGKQVVDQESPGFGMGIVISDGMLVTSYRSIKPSPTTNTALTRARARGMTIETEVTAISLLDESGEEFDAKLVLHDDDLDLAFIAIDRTSENASSWSCEPAKVNENAELDYLDDIIFLSRLGENVRFQPSLRTAQIHTILKRPRKFYISDKQIAGSATFNSAGEFIGLCIRKPNSGRELGVIIPAKDIMKLLPQAITKAKSMESDADAEEEEEEEADTEKSDAEEASDQPTSDQS